MRRTCPPVLAALAAAALLLALAPTASAAVVDPTNPTDPLRFEEAFIPGTGDPRHPVAEFIPADPENGWIVTETGGGTVEIRSDCGARESVIPGTDVQCLFIRETLLGGESGVVSPNISKPDDDFNWGFRFYIDSLISSGATKAMRIIGSSDQTIGSGNYIGFVTNKDGDVRALSNLGPQDTGFDVLEDVWYYFRIEMSGLTQKIYVNETGFSPFNALWVPPENQDLIDTRTVAGAWTGFSQWSMEVATGGGGILHFPETDVGIVNIESDPEEDACLLTQYRYTLETNSGETSYAFLSALPGFFDQITDDQPGAPKSKTFVRVGGPEAVGAVGLAVGVVNNAGEREQSWTLDVENCGFGEAGGSWLRTYWPAWVAFLAFLAVGIFIVKALWDGARGRMRR